MDNNTSPTSPNYTKYSVLPPVTTSEVDRTFIKTLQEYLENEISQIDPSDKRQRYEIHSAAWSKVIEHVTAYKPLLNRVKKEYDTLIATVETGKKEANYLNDKIQTMSLEPTTLRNYRRRADELSKRIDVIREDNNRLAEEVAQLQAANRSRFQAEEEAAKPEPRKPKYDPRKIPVLAKKGNAKAESKPRPKFVPGLSLEESTDMESLQRELNKVENAIRDVSSNKKSKFTDKQHKEDLKTKLSRKVDERDLLLQQNTWLQAKQKRLKVAHDASVNYMKSKETQHRSIGDVIILALAKNKVTSDDVRRDASGLAAGLGSVGLEEDDPTREKEAETILEYIEKFNELFEDGKYEQAAIHAANSPKGILRTMETMNRFVKVEAHRDGRSPWLAFCDAIMSSVLALGIKPSDTMSIECVRCVLKENRLDLLSHWVAQDRLTMTEKLGDMIADHCKGRNRPYLDMAETIYRHCLAHHKVVHVMVRQGLYQRALNYAQDKADFITNDYIELLLTHKNEKLAYSLCELKNEATGELLIPVGSLCRALVEVESEEVALQLLQKLYLRGPEETGTENNGLKMAVFNDGLTTSQQWHEVINMAQQHGYEEVALELLAATTVHKVMKSARENSNLSEKSMSELNFSSRNSSPPFHQPPPTGDTTLIPPTTVDADE